jgi:hypothetical protein
MTLETKRKLLRDIPQIGISGAFDDEITYKAIGVDLNNDEFKDSYIKLGYKKGVTLLSGAKWSDIEYNSNISSIKKTMVEVTEEIIDTNLEFALGKKKFNCKLSLEFKSGKDDIKESFIKNNSFAAIALIVELEGKSGNIDKLTEAENKTLRKKIREFKETYESKLNNFISIINQHSGKNIIGTIVK